MAALTRYPDDATARVALLREVEAPTLPAGWLTGARLSLSAPLASAVLAGHQAATTDVVWSTDGRRIVSTSRDQTVRVWSADGQGEPLVLTGHLASVTAIAWSPDGRRIASASEDTTLRVWRVDPPGLRGALRGHTKRTLCAAFSPDGTSVASGSADKTVRLWRADGTSRILTGHPDWVLGVAFSPDGRRLVSAGSGDGAGRVWDTRQGKMLPRISPAPGKPILAAIAWSPEGTRLAVACEDANVRLAPADATGEPLVLHGHSAWVRSVSWSLDGKRLASATDDGTVRVWNTDGTGEPLVLRGHEGAVWSVAYSPDGICLASAGMDKTLRIWRLGGGSEPYPLHGRRRPRAHLDRSRAPRAELAAPLAGDELLHASRAARVASRARERDGARPRGGVPAPRGRGR